MGPEFRRRRPCPVGREATSSRRVSGALLTGVRSKTVIVPVIGSEWLMEIGDEARQETAPPAAAAAARTAGISTG